MAASGLGDDRERGALLLGGPGFVGLADGGRHSSSVFGGGATIARARGRATTGTSGGAATGGGTYSGGDDGRIPNQQER